MRKDSEETTETTEEKTTRGPSRYTSDPPGTMQTTIEDKSSGQTEEGFGKTQEEADENARSGMDEFYRDFLHSIE